MEFLAVKVFRGAHYLLYNRKSGNRKCNLKEDAYFVSG
jgi:hypothetical protein